MEERTEREPERGAGGREARTKTNIEQTRQATGNCGWQERTWLPGEFHARRTFVRDEAADIDRHVRESDSIISRPVGLILNAIS